MLHFAQPGVAEAELEADVARSLRLMLYGLSGDAPPGLPRHLLTGVPAGGRLLDAIPEPPALPGWLTAEDLAYYTVEFQRTGFAGALARYRCLDRDWRASQGLPEVVGAPALFLGGEHDTATMVVDWGSLRALAPRLREAVVLPGCGHWIQQERPDDVTRHLMWFLRAVRGG